MSNVNLKDMSIAEVIAYAETSGRSMNSILLERDSQIKDAHAAELKAAKASNQGSGIYFVVTGSGHFGIRGTRKPMNSPFFYVAEAEAIFNDEEVRDAARAFLAAHKSDFSRADDSKVYKLRTHKDGTANYDGGKVESKE